jgi:hypothetical protein
MHLFAWKCAKLRHFEVKNAYTLRKAEGTTDETENRLRNSAIQA